MIKIKVNGKEIEGRVFQNMPQALAFAFQNGNCHMAQTLEFASGEEKPKEPVKLVGTVSITGLLKEGEVLTADISGLEGLTGEETVNYQWGKAHIDSEVQQAIPEATGKEYTLTPEDAGMVINVGVEVSGFTGSVMSKDYGQVAAAEGTETTETIAGTSFEEMTTEELKFYIQKEEGGWKVAGPLITRLMVRTNFGNEAAVQRFLRRLSKIGVDKTLREQGVKNGDTVLVGAYEFEFLDE